MRRAPPLKDISVEITLKPAAADEPLLLTAAAAAEFLGLSHTRFSSVRPYGRLPRPVQLGWGRNPRWRTAELRAWVAAGCPRTDKWEADPDGTWRATPELGENRAFHAELGAASRTAIEQHIQRAETAPRDIGTSARSPAQPAPTTSVLTRRRRGADDVPKVSYRFGDGLVKEECCTTGQLQRNDPDGHDVRASDGVQPRASNLMQAVLNGLKRHGFAIGVEGPSHRRETAARFDGIKVSLVVRERTRQQRVASPTWDYNKVVYVPMGDLTVTASAEFVSSTWSDTRKERLDSNVERLVNQVLDVWVRADRQRSDEAARRTEIAASEERARENAARKAERERARGQLIAMAENWHQAELLRSFANAAERVFSTDRPIEAGDERARWLAMVRKEADVIDPMITGTSTAEPWPEPWRGILATRGCATRSP